MKYEKPKLINLDGCSTSSGASCLSGTGANICQTGYSGTQCVSGGSPTFGSCGSGTSGLAYCSTGSTPGYCQSGNVASSICSIGSGI